VSAQFKGMTVNERLYESGLLTAWDTAFLRKDRNAMIDILRQVDLSEQAEWIIDELLTRPQK
jgi:hypothetical protein